MRKEARKHPEFKSTIIFIFKVRCSHLISVEKKSKDIKIPKLAPFKDELLQQAEVAKQQVCLRHFQISAKLIDRSIFQLEQERQLKKQQRALARQQQKSERPKSLESLVNDVERRQNVFDEEYTSSVRIFLILFSF